MPYRVPERRNSNQGSGRKINQGRATIETLRGHRPSRKLDVILDEEEDNEDPELTSKEKSIFQNYDVEQDGSICLFTKKDGQGEYLNTNISDDDLQIKSVHSSIELKKKTNDNSVAP